MKFVSNILILSGMRTKAVLLQNFLTIWTSKTGNIHHLLWHFKYSKYFSSKMNSIPNYETCSTNNDSCVETSKLEIQKTGKWTTWKTCKIKEITLNNVSKQCERFDFNINIYNTFVNESFHSKRKLKSWRMMQPYWKIRIFIIGYLP